MPGPGELAEIAAAVADGAPLDWESLLDVSESQAVRDDVESLRLIARIAEVHGSSAWADRTEGPRTTGDPSASPHVDLPAGTTWGSLRLLERIGQGTFGDVYRAWDPRLEREVALKLLRSDPARSPVGAAALEAAVVHEARLLARVRHPGVATIFGADHIDGRTGLWMELVRGRTLEDEVARQGPLSPGEVARCGHAIADALAAVHAAGLLHRDVKTQNIMRDTGGRLVLMDFGAGLEHTAIEDAGPLAGTPLYLAPEVIAGGAPTPAADIYSMGVVLFRLATGDYPVPGRTLQEVRAAHARGLRRTLAQLRPELPNPLVEAIDRALSPDPQHRFASAMALRDALAATPSPPVAEPSPKISMRSVLAVATLLALVVASLVSLGAPSRAPAPALSLGPQEWVLVTALENTTGIPRFDGTIEYVLRQELAASPLVRVASPDRVRDALALMRRDADTKVDLAVGREVSLRDGGIRALVTPRVDRIAAGLRLSTAVVAVADGRIVATDARTVADESRMLDAVVDQANWVRRTLGEAHSELASPPTVHRVTTSSLEALQLYSKATDLALRFQWAPAIKLLESAIEHDPRFASAHISLAWALANTRGPDAGTLEVARRARELASDAADAERYFIEGSFHTLMGQAPGATDPYERFAEAAAAYEALLQVEPNHYFGTMNLLGQYESLQRFEAAVPLALTLAKGRPNDVRAQVRAANALVSWKGDLTGAAPFVNRAIDLIASGAAAQSHERSWVDVFEAHEAWATGDIEGAHAATDRVAWTLPGRTGTSLDDYARRVGSLYLTLGRCEDARAAFERADPTLRHELLALQAMQCDDADGVDRHLVADARAPGDPSYQRIMWAARGGNLARARGWVNEFRQSRQNRIVLAVADGELAYAGRNWPMAIAHLERAWGYLKGGGQERACLVAERLASAYRRTGRTDKALDVLRATTAMRPRLFELLSVGHGGMAWIRAQVALADLYTELGRPAEAAQIVDAVRPLLRAADPDLPLLEKVRQ